MSNRERVVVFVLLGALTAVNVLPLLDRSGPTAWAEPLPVLDEIGPTTALRLSGEGDDLLLRNESGRVAWGDEVQDRAYSVGFVFIGKVLAEMMGTDEVIEERERLRDELAEEEQEYQEQLQAIQARGQGLDPEQDEDALQRTFEEWQQAEQAYRQWQQQAMARTGKLESEYLEQSYRELIDAVNLVADRMNIDIVYRFTPPDADFETDNPRGTMSTIRMRSALRYPEDLDITDSVLEELGLD